MYIGIEVTLRIFCPAFSFSPVLIQRHLVKFILIRNWKSMKGGRR